MDLSLTPEQEMLKAAASRLVSQEYPKETLLQIASPDETTPLEPWGQLAGTGWLGILIPQQYGGEGGSFTDAGVLFEELGRGPVPGPHLTSAVLSALTVLEGGTEQQKRDWLPRIASGDMRLVPAITERDYGWDVRDVRTAATVDGDGLRISGSKGIHLRRRDCHPLPLRRPLRGQRGSRPRRSPRRRPRRPCPQPARLRLEPGRSSIRQRRCRTHCRPRRNHRRGLGRVA